MKTLFVLTKTYPFGSGEPYLTEELKVLAKEFNKIVIYPNDHYGETVPHNRRLAANIEVLNFNYNLQGSGSNSPGDYAYLLKCTIREFFTTDDKKYFFKNFKWNLINFWTQFQLAKRFSKYLNDNDFNPSNTLFYSYWFHKSALLLGMLKEKGTINSFVSRGHSIDLYHNDWGIINDKVKVPPFKMFKLKNVDQLVCISRHGENYLRSKYHKYRHKFSTHYLGVANAHTSSTMDHSIFRIATCSGVDLNKRLNELAKALAKVKAGVRWTHFGTGVLFESLKKQISALPVNIEVELKGPVPNQEVIKFYAENRPHLFINLSIVEGLPVSIMEAMTAGIPILATKVYGTPEAVIENENGFLLDVGFNTEELAAKINHCINNREQLSRMGNRSRELYSEKFNSEKNYRAFAHFLKSI